MFYVYTWIEVHIFLEDRASRDSNLSITGINLSSPSQIHLVIFFLSYYSSPPPLPSSPTFSSSWISSSLGTTSTWSRKCLAIPQDLIYST